MESLRKSLKPSKAKADPEDGRGDGVRNDVAMGCIAYGSIWGWMNIHLPAISMFTSGTGF